MGVSLRGETLMLRRGVHRSHVVILPLERLGSISRLRNFTRNAKLAARPFTLKLRPSTGRGRVSLARLFYVD